MQLFEYLRKIMIGNSSLTTIEMGSEMVGWKYEILLPLKNSPTPKFSGAVVLTKWIADEIITTSELNSAARGELELRQQLWYFPLELCSYVLSELSLMDFESLGSLWIRGGIIGVRRQRWRRWHKVWFPS